VPDASAGFENPHYIVPVKPVTVNRAHALGSLVEEPRQDIETDHFADPVALD